MIVKLTHKNGDWETALSIMTTICVGIVVEGKVVVANRLLTIPSLRADRTFRAIREAWEGCQRDKEKLFRDLGKDDGTGLLTIEANTKAMREYQAAWNAVLEEEQTISVETLTVADLDAGWSRDMTTGKKGPLELGPSEQGDLIALGILIAPEEKKEPQPRPRKKRKKE